MKLPAYVRRLIAFASRLAASRRKRSAADRRKVYLVTYARLRRAALRAR